MKPILVAADVRLMREAYHRLIQRYARHLGINCVDGRFDLLVVSSRVGFKARTVNQRVQRGVFVTHGIKYGVLAMIRPEEKVLWVVQPTTKIVNNEWHVFA